MRLKIPATCQHGRIVYEYFPSVDALATVAENGKPYPGAVLSPKGHRVPHPEIMSHGPDSFYGPSPEDTLTLARTGWRDGLRHAQRLAARLELTGAGGTAYRFSPSRGRFSVPRTVGYLTGARGPAVRRRKVRRDRPRPIKVLAHGAFLAEVGWPLAERRGAAVTALVVALIQLGYPVDVSVLRFSELRDKRAVVAQEVKIMEGGRGLDRDRLAFALGHPAMMRRFFLSRSGGATVPIVPEIASQADVVLQQVNPHDPSFQSDEAALQWVAEQVRTVTGGNGLEVTVR